MAPPAGSVSGIASPSAKAAPGSSSDGNRRCRAAPASARSAPGMSRATAAIVGPASARRARAARACKAIAPRTITSVARQTSGARRCMGRQISTNPPPAPAADGSACPNEHEELREEEIGDEDRDRDDYDRARGRLSDAFGAARRDEAKVAADQRDDRAEDRALADAAQEVLHGERVEGGFEEEAGRDVQLRRRDRHRARKSEDERKRREDRYHDDRGDEARHDELLDGIGAERVNGVDLLGDGHRADLRRHARTDAPADDHGRQRGRELTREREADDAPRVLHAAELLKAEGALHRD